MKRLSAKLHNLQRQQAAEEKAEATRKQADLLTANLHRCKQGEASVQVGGVPAQEGEQELERVESDMPMVMLDILNIAGHRRRFDSSCLHSKYKNVSSHQAQSCMATLGYCVHHIGE